MIRKTVLLTLVAVLAWSPINASAQEPDLVDGGSDWRTATAIENGSHIDTITAGGSAWYRFAYRPGAFYRIEAAPVDADLDGIDVTAELVDPDLIVTGAASSKIVGTSTYRTQHQAEWFVHVHVATDGRVGEPVNVRISMESGSAQDTLDCRQSLDCVLDDQLDEVLAETAGITAELQAAASTEAVAEVQAAIDASQQELNIALMRQVAAEAELDAATAAIGEMCAPAPACDTRPLSNRTPSWAWLAAVAVALTSASTIILHWRKTS